MRLDIKRYLVSVYFLFRNPFKRILNTILNLCKTMKGVTNPSYMSYTTWVDTSPLKKRWYPESILKPGGEC